MNRKFTGISAVVFGLSLFVSSEVSPTQAKLPIGTTLIAQEANLLLQPSIPDADPIVDNTVTPNSQTEQQSKTFLDTAAPSSSVSISVPPESGLYIYGGVGDTAGTTNRRIFSSFFKGEDYGVLGASGETTVKGPVVAKVISPAFLSLSSGDISRIKSVKLTFDYAFVSDKNNQDTLSFSVQRVGSKTAALSATLPPTAGTRVNVDITSAFTEPGRYLAIVKFVKPGNTKNDAVGFSNTVLTITRSYI